MALRASYDYQSLAKSKSARDFLRNALKHYYSNQTRINLANFSRRTGFASRSFVSEYLAGKKGLSLDSLQRIKTALKLPKDAAILFSNLVYIDQPELALKQLGRSEIENQISKARAALIRKQSLDNSRIEQPELIRSLNIHQVYAALGSQETGATQSQIAARTRLNGKIIENTLQTLLNSKTVQQNGDRFYVVSDQIDTLGLSPESGIVDLVNDATREINKDREKILSDSRNFIFYSAFSMNAAKAEALKNRMKEVIFEVLDEYQDDDGDDVRQMFLCLRGP